MSRTRVSNLESLPINEFFKKQSDPKKWLPARFFPYRNISESHTINYTDEYLEGLTCIFESPLATAEQHRIARWMYAHVSLKYFLAVFALMEPTAAEISRPDAMMALLREPPTPL
ncbi:hypothetical protein BGZ74_008052 [Mortierella antarctica]|nr:hypothetical protein BGZ74_008052 [Mortierella antarctica]